MKKSTENEGSKDENISIVTKHELRGEDYKNQTNTSNEVDSLTFSTTEEVKVKEAGYEPPKTSKRSSNYNIKSKHLESLKELEETDSIGCEENKKEFANIEIYNEQIEDCESGSPTKEDKQMKLSRATDDNTEKEAEEDKSIMMDLFDIALGAKCGPFGNISEKATLKREKIINEFSKTHFQNTEIHSSPFMLQQSNEGNGATNCLDENSKSNKHKKIIATFKVKDTSDDRESSIGLSAAEETEIKDILEIAERAYKGKIDTTKDRIKIEENNEGINIREKDSNNKGKEEEFKNYTEINVKKTVEDTKITERKKQDRASTEVLEHQFSNEDGSVINNVFNEIKHENADFEENKVNEGQNKTTIWWKHDNKLPMNDEHGGFYIDRSFCSIDMYQERLKNHKWNPTEVLNELCSKLGWESPIFGRIEHRQNQGFLVAVTIRGREFVPTQWGKSKKEAKHLASAHFLKYLGFTFENNPSDITDDIPVSTVREPQNKGYDTLRNRQNTHGYERVKKPDLKKLRPEESNNKLSSRPSLQYRRSKSSDRCMSPRREDLTEPGHSKTFKNALNTLNLAELLKLKDSAVIVINNFEGTPGSSRRRRHSTSSSSPSPRETREWSKPRQKQIGDESRSNKESSQRPSRWENVDEIPPFVPRKLYHQNDKGPSRRSYEDVHRPYRSEGVRPHRCRCKPSFPHPSIHPWRTMLASSRFSSAGSASNTSGSRRTHSSYKDV